MRAVLSSANRSYLFFALVGLGVATFLIFQNLGTPAIRQWDEAIYADNALDMYYTGDPIVMRRNGEITFYNTKPPLVIWLQTLSLHVFGVNEFAIRFPSALAGILICMMLLVFSVKTLDDIRIGIIAVFVLATTYGFVKQHVVKTGDLDAVLVFWVTGYTLLFLHFLLKEPERFNRLLLWMSIFVTCAFLSKGVAGLIPLPGLLLCALVMKKAKWFFKQRQVWIAAASILAVCMGYYVLREVISHGYLFKTWHSEYTRFFVNVMSWHNHPWYYYFWNWQRLEFFTPYVYVLPFMILAGLISMKMHKITLLLTLFGFVFVGILSYPIVKLMWYDAPVYPVLALLCGVGYIALWDWLSERMKLKSNTRIVVFGVVVILVFAIPVEHMYRRNADLRMPVDILEREGFFIRELSETKPDIKNYKVLMLAEQNAHYTQLDFYLNAYQRYKSYDLELYSDNTEVSIGDTIAVCQEEQIDWIKEHFISEELSSGEAGCKLLHIVAAYDRSPTTRE